MDDPTPLIDNAAPVVALYGRWPTFHDADLRRLTLDLVTPSSERPRCEATLLAFRMTDKVDARGYYVLEDHALVTLCFENVHVACLPEFEIPGLHQLLGLTIELADTALSSDRRLKVTLWPVAGGHGVLYCDRASVLSLERITPSV